MEQGQEDTMCIPSTRKCERWQIIHSGPQRRGQQGYTNASFVPDRLAPQPLAGSPAIPYTMRLMVLWSWAANLSLSRNKPLHWQMSGIVPMLPCLECRHLMAPTIQGLLRKLFEIWANFCCQTGNQDSALWDRKFGICLLTAVDLYTHRMRICKLESGQF